MRKKSDREQRKYYVSVYTSIVLNKIEEFRLQTSTDLYEEFPFTSSKRLLEIIARILTRYEEDIKSACLEYGETHVADLLRKIETINYLVCNAIPLLLEAVHKSINVSIVLPVVEAYHQIIRQVRFGSKAIIYPSYEYNATFYDAMALARDISGFHEDDVKQALFTGTPPYFAIISYPWAEESDVLRQSLIAHEVAHFVDLELKWTDKITEEQLFSEEDVQLVDETAKKISPHMQLPEDEVAYSIRQLINEMVDGWNQELVSDYLAVCMVGPAYLLAFDEFAFGLKKNMVSGTPINQSLSISHPPSVLRKHLVSSVCEFLYFSNMRDGYKGFNPKNEDFVNLMERISIIETKQNEDFSGIDEIEGLPFRFTQTVYKVLRNNLEIAVDVLNKKLLPEIVNQPWYFRVEDFIEAFPLVDLLTNDLIPLNENISDTASSNFPKILNAGWIYLASNREEFTFDLSSEIADPGFQLKHTKYQNLQRLLSKAIENSLFTQTYSKKKGV